MMMISGSAVEKMIKRAVPGVIDAGALCELDVQAILLACRLASHGPTMKIDHTCTNKIEDPKGKAEPTECGYVNSIEIDLNEHIQRFGPYQDEEFEKFNLTLPKAGQTVRLRPIPYSNTIEVILRTIRSNIGTSKFNDVEENAKLSDEFITAYQEKFNETLDANIDLIKSSIYYVETKSGKRIFDPENIKQWLEILHTDDVAEINKRIVSINDEILERSKLEYQCQKCGSLNTLIVELDPQKLFTTAEDSETETNSSAKPKVTKRSTKTRGKVSQK